MDKAMHSEFEKDMTKIICEVCKVNDAIHYADSNYFCCSCISKKYTSLRSELQNLKGEYQKLYGNYDKHDGRINSLLADLQKQKDEFNDMRNNFHQINKQLMDDLVKQKELNAELVEGLENIQIGLTAMNWARDLDEKDQKEKYVFDLLESLIKKSKES